MSQEPNGPRDHVKAWAASLLRQARERVEAAAVVREIERQPVMTGSFLPATVGQREPEPIDRSSQRPRGLPPYGGQSESRVGPRSTKSTRDEKKGVSSAILQKIADSTRSRFAPERIEVPHEGEDEHTYIPPGMALKQSAVRKELETGKDKLELAMGKALTPTEKLRLGRHRGEAESEAQRHATMVPELVLEMLAHAVRQYKRLLDPPGDDQRWTVPRIIGRCLDDYIADMALEMEGETADPWADADRALLATDAGRAALSASPSFRRYLRHWTRGRQGVVEIAGEKHRAAPPFIEREIDRMSAGARTFWFRSVLNVAAVVGTLDVHHPKPYAITDRSGERITIAEALGLETQRDENLTQVDAALILRDAGFRYHIDGRAGKAAHYVDWVRNEAERLGRYRGQF